MRILITGAAGFIGYHLAMDLAESGHEVVAVDNLQRGRMDTQFRTLLERPKVTFIEADLTQPEAFDSVGTGIEQVYHLGRHQRNGELLPDPRPGSPSECPLNAPLARVGPRS